MPVAAAVRRPLPGVDPARAWAYLADFAHLVEWCGAREVDWSGGLPRAGDRLSTIQPLAGARYRLDGEVTVWEAGRAYRIRMEGLPAAQDAEVDCRLDAYVEQGRPVAAVELRFRATARPLLAGFVQRRARIRLERAAARLAAGLGAGKA